MIEQPAPDDIKAAREHAGDTQAQAAARVHANLRTWQSWEDSSGSKNARAIPLAAWELYLIKTGQAETY